MAQADPGRAAPFGYDREILAPDSSVMFRIRFCPGRVREVYDKDGKLQEIVLLDEDMVDTAIERFVERVGRQNRCTTDAERIAREIKQVGDLVTALT